MAVRQKDCSSQVAELREGRDGAGDLALFAGLAVPAAVTAIDSRGFPQGCESELELLIVGVAEFYGEFVEPAVPVLVIRERRRIAHTSPLLDVAGPGAGPPVSSVGGL
ncbi:MULTISPECIES: hypothetical protein [unclassified Streptomyces]|uniref:hypothetical protein n=1 Tax=unclassified Streptomyces TaxID=2593676 RepID=UPI002E11B989|nr:hypothetical protein OG533_15385 [Streptomyces sp. NBC_01186]WSS41911.1 hypothetical protein OG220_15920 [Streptomyces sp. NBC_01187]